MLLIYSMPTSLTGTAVNWSGGGQIKDSNIIWDVNSLTLAAANFPDLVAMTPQRTYAILTKYTALKSFHEQMGFFSPLGELQSQFAR